MPLGTLRRFRPFLVAVTAVILVTLVPSGRHNDKPRSRTSNVAASVAADSAAPTAAAAAAGATTTSIATATTVVSGGTARANTAGTTEAATVESPRQGSAAAAATATGTPAVSAGTFPGVGTAAALANPKCDSVRKHVRWPSIFAPSCVVPWPKGADNGGATTMGVTADKIRVVIYEDPNGFTGASKQDVERVARDTMLMRIGTHELWGRELDLRFFPWTGEDEVAQRADAIEIATNIKPFMATSMFAYGGTPRRVWAAELAARGVMTWEPLITSAEANQRPGYRWGFGADDKISALMVGEYVAKRLYGLNARWAGDATMKVQPRKFGLLYDKAWDPKTFNATLQKYRPGAALTDTIDYDPQEALASLQERARVYVARFKDRGVNNVIAVSGLFYTAIVTRAATAENFFPEWTITGWDVQDTAVGGKLADPPQWRNAFGIGSLVPFIKPNELREDLYEYEWVYGRRLTQSWEQTVLGELNTFARDFTNGLHLAGPRLTPAAFRDALFNMPPRGGRWCGCVTNFSVSFGRHLPLYGADKYFMNEDFDEKWWDPTTTGTDEIGLQAPGVYQHVAGGRRYLPGDFAAGEPPMFDTNGAVTKYEGTIPEPDRYPTYPK